MAIFFLGPVGTHTHHALARFIDSFGMNNVKIVPCHSVELVLRTLFKSSDMSDCAVIPLENSFGGSVTATWDTFLQLAEESEGTESQALRIAASMTLPIEHALFVKPGVSLSEIEVIYSHPQALVQCAPWIQKHLPQARCVPVESTAEAAHRVSKMERRNESAIASPLGGMVGELVCLAKSLQSSSNVTRFGWIQRHSTATLDNHLPVRQSLVLLGVRNQPGGLYDALRPFREEQLNLTRIESRPVGGCLGEYAFFLDIEWDAQTIQSRMGVWSDIKEQLASAGLTVSDLGTYNEIPHSS